MTVLYFVASLLISATVINSNDQSESAYYWRDYTGVIPPDAVPGGWDRSRKTTYIGQAIHTSSGALVPGLIDTTHNKLYYHFDAAGYKTNKNVKILCSPHTDYFEWIITDTEGTRFLTQLHLVPGGTDDGYPLLIGRADIDGQKVVGKVTTYHKYSGFAYAYEDKAKHQHFYEILTYNPKCNCTCNVTKTNIHFYN